jgi:hypothetical protein
MRGTVRIGIEEVIQKLKGVCCEANIKIEDNLLLVCDTIINFKYVNFQCPVPQAAAYIWGDGVIRLCETSWRAKGI